MRVCDLIEQLQTLNPDTVVVIANHDTDDYRVSEHLERLTVAWHRTSGCMVEVRNPNRRKRPDTLVQAVVLTSSPPVGVLDRQTRHELRMAAKLLREDARARARLVKDVE